MSFRILSITLIIHSIFALQLKAKNSNIIETTEDGIINELSIDPQCVITGKYKQLCIKENEEANDDLAIYQRKYDCLKDAFCKYSAEEENCQWIQTDKSTECSKKFKPKGLRIYKTAESYKESS